MLLTKIQHFSSDMAAACKGSCQLLPHSHFPLTFPIDCTWKFLQALFRASSIN